VQNIVIVMGRDLRPAPPLKELATVEMEVLLNCCVSVSWKGTSSLGVLGVVGNRCR
jgi:hypothetical protein